MTDKLLNDLLREAEEIKSKQNEAREYLQSSNIRLKKLAKIINLLDEEGIVDSSGLSGTKTGRYTAKTWTRYPDDFKKKVVAFALDNEEMGWTEISRKFDMPDKSSGLVKRWSEDPRYNGS